MRNRGKPAWASFFCLTYIEYQYIMETETERGRDCGAQKTGYADRADVLRAAGPAGGAARLRGHAVYALLERFEKDGLITRTRTEESRKYYCLTAEGERVLRTEYDRIRRQAHDMERALSGEGQGGTL